MMDLRSPVWEASNGGGSKNIVSMKSAFCSLHYQSCFTVIPHSGHCHQ